MKKVSVNRLFFVVFLYCLIANFVHPVTPSFIKELELHDYMFGLAFGCMAFTNFLFSPFWSKMCKRYGPGKIFSIAFFGYGTMQLFFGFSTSEWQICIARLFGGLFISALSVSQMLYVIKNSEDTGHDLTILATLSAVVSPFGFLLGGFIGDVSIRLTFIIQSIGLFATGVISWCLLKDSNIEAASFTIKEVNPFIDFVRSKELVIGAISLFFIMVLCSSFASTCYEQCFNYYIKDQFNFPSSYNGMLKAGVGFIALAANTFITSWLLKTDIFKNIKYVFVVLFAMLIVVILIEQIGLFIIVNVVFFGFNSIYIPLLQDMMTKRNKDKQNEMVGLYNATRAIGMVVGSLFSGFVYEVNPKMSFTCAAVFFFICVLISIRHEKMAKAENE